MIELKSAELIPELYRLYSDQIFRFIVIMIGDPVLAEDLTQEVYLRAIKSIESFQGKASEKTWLFTIARNLVIDHQRKRKVLAFLPEWFHSNLQAKEGIPEVIYELGEEAEQIYVALKRLKVSYREVIILRKLKELSITETAQILNWSEAKVKSTQLRALEALKLELVKEGYVYETV